MIIAVYSAKGGVGKTTLAVNLAWASAALSSRKTLLWDLDAQGAASYILGQEPGARATKARITRDADVSDLTRPSNIAGVDVLPADESLRKLDYAFHELGKRKRLANITAELSHSYDRIIIDWSSVSVCSLALAVRWLNSTRAPPSNRKGPVT